IFIREERSMNNNSRDKQDQKQKKPLPPQHQNQQPGIESLMVPKPIIEDPNYQGSGKLKDKVDVITGGDSGIGAAAAIAFAEDEDAYRTKHRIEQLGRKCLLIVGDLRDENQCKHVIHETLNHFGKINILVNNHAVQFTQDSLLDISTEQWDATFQTNIYGHFYMTKAALPHLENGDAIINTTSITAYEGQEKLIDYSATKGAIVAFTRSLSLNLIDKGIRVNAVAPGPIWTPLIPASFSAEYIGTEWGTEVPMKRAGQPFELAPAYVYLASNDSTYVSGQVIHVNGGKMVSS